MTITGGSIARELRAKSDLPVIFLTSKAEMIDEVSHRWLSFLKQSVIQLGRFLQQLRHLGYPRRNSPSSSWCSDGFRCEPVIQKALFAASLQNVTCGSKRAAKSLVATDYQREKLALCIAPILWSWLSKDYGCASETTFQASVKIAPAEPSVQESGIKGVAATGAICDINLMRFAEKTLPLEINFCTHVTQSDYHG
jgi:CheY-like chemotaxis protein